MILDQLKSGTAAVHASLERRLLLAQAAPTLASYSSYLRAMHGFIAPLEEGFRQLPGPWAATLDLNRRCKADLIVADLGALSSRLGPSAPALVRCADLPAQGSVAQALGALYVLEGSTLGARWLLRHLAPLEIESASAYLSSYGDDLGFMWQKMRTALLAHSAQRPEQDPQVVAAALETFERLDAWFVRTGAAETSRAA